MIVNHLRLLILTLVCLVISAEARAQRIQRQAIGVINDVQVDAQVHVAPAPAEPRIETLAREVKYMTQVAELTADEADAFSTAAQRLVMNRALGAVRRVDIVNGRAVAAESPAAAMRRGLTPLLKQISFKGWEKFDADRERLDARQKRAARLSFAAELDEAVWLSADQRRELCDILTARGDEGWQPNVPKAPLFPRSSTQEWLIAAGSLGGFDLPTAEWSGILRPSQLALYAELQRPPVRLVQQAVRRLRVMAPAAPAAPPPPPPGMRPPAERQAAPAAVAAPAPAAPPPPPAGMRPPAERQAAPAAAPAQGVHFIQGGAVFQNAIAIPELTIEAQQQRLNTQLGQLIDRIDGCCQLTERQREKLHLAGKIDIQRQFEQAPPAGEPPNEQAELLAAVKRSAALAQWPPAVFTAADSAYQKALRKQLSGDQQARLSADARARREFQQQALVETIIVGFARSASLTSDQCEEVAAALTESLSDMPDDAARNWPTQGLRHIAELPEEKVRPLFSDFQWPAAQRHLATLAAAAQQVEEQAKQPVPVMMNGVIQIVD